ncbi:MAG TPA: nodulation protein NfeD [Candidatus Acidoferrales bacterium]|nr:nodulation protein NfeD [Candidatus Acidoferrales bacterium]
MIPRKRPWKSWSSKPRGSRPRNPARALLFFFAIVLAASWLAGPQRRTAAAAGQAAGPAVPSPRVIEIPIEGVIQPFLADFVDEALAHAASEHASLVLLTLNTPGGLDTAMRDIIQHIIASPVPVAAYVSPSGSRAASAGFYILLSADVAVMAPGTDTGASSPVFLIGGTAAQVDETLKKKAMNEAAAYLRSICGNRGRNVDLAEKAVTEAKAFSDTEALNGKLIDLVASSPEDLFAKLEGRTITRFDGSTLTLHLRGAVISHYEVSSKQKFLGWLAEPDLMFILLIVGLVGLYVEFTHPGLILPGVLGGVALLLFLVGAQVVPINLFAILLIASAVALFAIEAKVTSHGVLALLGVVAMLAGALVLVRSPITGEGVSPAVALGFTIPFAVLAVVVMRLALRTFTMKPSTGNAQLVGQIGEMREPVDGTGMVFVGGELWQARAQQQIPTGSKVRVVRVDGLTLEVAPATLEKETQVQAPS